MQPPREWFVTSERASIWAQSTGHTFGHSPLVRHSVRSRSGGKTREGDGFCDRRPLQLSPRRTSPGSRPTFSSWSRDEVGSTRLSSCASPCPRWVSRCFLSVIPSSQRSSVGGRHSSSPVRSHRSAGLGTPRRPRRGFVDWHCRSRDPLAHCQQSLETAAIWAASTQSERSP